MRNHGGGPAICAFIGLPGDFDACQSLRTNSLNLSGTAPELQTAEFSEGYVFYKPKSGAEVTDGSFPSSGPTWLEGDDSSNLKNQMML